MLAVAVNGEFVSAGSGYRQVLQPQVDVGVAKTCYRIFADDLVGGFRLEDDFAFRSPEFYGERVMAFGVEADLRKEPERRQRRAKIRNDEAVEDPHQAEFAALLFSDIVAQCSEKQFSHGNQINSRLKKLSFKSFQSFKTFKPLNSIKSQS